MIVGALDSARALLLWLSLVRHSLKYVSVLLAWKRLEVKRVVLLFFPAVTIGTGGLIGTAIVVLWNECARFPEVANSLAVVLKNIWFAPKILPVVSVHALGLVVFLVKGAPLSFEIKKEKVSILIHLVDQSRLKLFSVVREWAVVPVLALAKMLWVFCAVFRFVLLWMVDALNSIVRIWAAVSPLAGLTILKLAQVRLISQIINILPKTICFSFFMRKIVDNLGCLWKLKLSASILASVIISAMLMIVLFSIGHILAFLRLEFGQVKVLYNLRGALRFKLSSDLRILPVAFFLICVTLSSSDVWHFLLSNRSELALGGCKLAFTLRSVSPCRGGHWSANLEVGRVDINEYFFAFVVFYSVLFGLFGRFRRFRPETNDILTGEIGGILICFDIFALGVLFIKQFHLLQFALLSHLRQLLVINHWHLHLIVSSRVRLVLSFWAIWLDAFTGIAVARVEVLELVWHFETWVGWSSWPWVVVARVNWASEALGRGAAVDRAGVDWLDAQLA